MLGLVSLPRKSLNLDYSWGFPTQVPTKRPPYLKIRRAKPEPNIVHIKFAQHPTSLVLLLTFY